MSGQKRHSHIETKKLEEGSDREPHATRAKMASPRCLEAQDGFRSVKVDKRARECVTSKEAHPHRAKLNCHKRNSKPKAAARPD